jgi:hypothetical protein
MESIPVPAAAPLVLRRVVRKGPHLKTCVRCFEQKLAYVVGQDDICTACRAIQDYSKAVFHHSDR